MAPVERGFERFGSARKPPGWMILLPSSLRLCLDTLFLCFHLFRTATPSPPYEASSRDRLLLLLPHASAVIGLLELAFIFVAY
jgi:hypothetical protein